MIPRGKNEFTLSLGEVKGDMTGSLQSVESRRCGAFKLGHSKETTNKKINMWLIQKYVC